MPYTGICRAIMLVVCNVLESNRTSVEYPIFTPNPLLFSPGEVVSIDISGEPVSEPIREKIRRP